MQSLIHPSRQSELHALLLLPFSAVALCVNVLYINCVRMDRLPGDIERSCKRVQVLLEVVGSAPLDLEGEGHLMVPPLFAGLEHYLDKLEGEGQDSGEGQGWEYTCQLILSLLLQWCNKMAAMTDKGGAASKT